MAKLSTIRIDPGAATEGLWFPFAEGIELLIGRMPNTKFETKLRRLGRPHAARLRRMSEAEQEKDPTFEASKRAAMGGTVLLGWKNIEDENGKPLEFSEKKAEEILLDPELDEVYQFVHATAMTSAIFRRDQEQAAEGNSLPSSTGS